MTEETPTRWSPMANRERVPFHIEHDGERYATIWLRKWTARERLEFDDTLAVRALTTMEGTDRQTARIGLLRMVRVRMTCVGSEGLPDVYVERPGADGQLVEELEPFNVRDELHLGQLDTSVFADLLRACVRVQAVPELDGATTSEETATISGEVVTTDLVDPSPTQQTAVPVEDPELRRQVQVVYDELGPTTKPSDPTTP